VVIKRLLWDESFQSALILADWMSGAGYSQEHSSADRPARSARGHAPNMHCRPPEPYLQGVSDPRQVNVLCAGAGLASG
jgi:hypothetical protein